MRGLDPISFAYCVILIGALSQIANWLAPYDNLTAEGCTLNYVYDGDTVALDCGSERITARVLGLDAPEAKSPQCEAEKVHAAKATARLRDLSQSGALTFSGHARDKYGRLLVRMKSDGEDVADTLIREGLAVRYAGAARIDWCERLGA
ncbi:MAG: thermonuclease family protein [Loktanella sp.]|jgi:micrococcal nuclease|nr:thermonuclease family protein [Loktanella sp.]MDO7608996.1 thermonuclease family protein [Loktanella sp.]MDO7621668.1 thermonuclease family protein [Loktanella sp.]MDO7625006.1 thermonuclease family protein [Loktanella sp.]MDO7666640.1 thermonuclease family protein [Loktanella sp.]